MVMTPSLALAPTRATIEAARQAWLSTCRELGDHVDACGPCDRLEDCATYARLDAAERSAWRAFEQTKGGHRGYL